MKLYITDGALWLLAIFYAPLVLWLLWLLWRKLPARPVVRSLGLVVALAIAIAIPLGDVLSTSLKMAELCPQAGIFVHRPVKVEGFYTNLGGPDMLERGFKYIEASKPAGLKYIDAHNPGVKIVVYQQGAAPLEFDARTYKIKSRYEFIYDEESGAYQGSRSIGIGRSVVRDRETREELGYALSFSVYPGWVEQITFGLFGKILWHCQAYPDQDIRFLYQALLPMKNW